MRYCRGYSSSQRLCRSIEGDEREETRCEMIPVRNTWHGNSCLGDEAGMVGLAPKWVRLDPKLDKSGTFSDQISVHLTR